MSPPFMHFTWAGTGTFYWKLCTIDTLGNFVLVQDGTTTSTFKDFATPDIDNNEVYYFQVNRVCSGVPSTPISLIVSIPVPPEVIVTPPGSTTISYHVFNLPAPIHKTTSPTCGKTNKGNVQKVNIKVNGTYIGTNLVISLGGVGSPSGSCNQLGGTWIHATQVGPSYSLVTPGSLTNATVVMEMLDVSNNPAVYTGSISPTPMYTTALVPVTGVISGSNNHIITWTGVDISPAFLSYVHLYLNPPIY
jgi:hypothetical protein